MKHIIIVSFALESSKEIDSIKGETLAIALTNSLVNGLRRITPELGITHITERLVNFQGCTFSILFSSAKRIPLKPVK